MNEFIDNEQLEKMGYAMLVKFSEAKECEQKEKHSRIKNLKIYHNIQRVTVGCWILNTTNITYRTITRKSPLEAIALLVSTLILFINWDLCKKTKRKIRTENEEFLKIGEQIDICKKLIKRFNCSY